MEIKRRKSNVKFPIVKSLVLYLKMGHSVSNCSGFWILVDTLKRVNTTFLLIF
jgi:hypothetical protein